MKQKLLQHKKFLIIVGSLIIIGAAFAIWQFNSSPASAMMTEEEATEIATNQYSGEIVELKQDREDNKQVYEIKIQGDDRLYDLTIDAETGDILELDEDMVQQADNSNNQETEGNNDGNNTQQENSNNERLSTEEVTAIAQEEYDGEVIDLDFDGDDGRQYYDIEMLTDEAEIELEIDAYSGEIITKSEDRHDQTQQGNEALLSADEASNIALEEYDGEITDLDFDEDDGRQYYEIEVTTSEAEIDLDIDAYTGEIVSISRDYHND
ncbi:PepSY domain-containing protein [Gracilibacillus timonensis]|uniref:PepSY domain-containing protein n=1 Tax=Gracilibacillus timonensis TaxID=1816696 RepID=UPI0008250B9B|nr:PepSY domain-containing protein [Gracilibacillus timonensis]